MMIEFPCNYFLALLQGSLPCIPIPGLMPGAIGFPPLLGSAGSFATETNQDCARNGTQIRSVTPPLSCVGIFTLL